MVKTTKSTLNGITGKKSPTILKQLKFSTTSKRPGPLTKPEHSTGWIGWDRKVNGNTNVKLM